MYAAEEEGVLNSEVAAVARVVEAIGMDGVVKAAELQAVLRGRKLPNTVKF